MLGIKWKGRKGQILVQERRQQSPQPALKMKTCITEHEHLFFTVAPKKIRTGTANFCKASDY